MTPRHSTGRSAAVGALALGVLLAVGVVGVTSGCGSPDGTSLGSVDGPGGVGVRSASVGEGERIAAGYLVLEGGDDPDRLVGASSPAAALVSLHRTDPSGAMVDADAVDVPAGGEVPFLPGGDHLMLEGLVAPLLPGTSVVLDLEFAGAGVVRVEAPVVALVDVLDTYDGGW